MAKRNNPGNEILDMIQAKFPDYHPLMAIADIAHNPSPEISWELRVKCHGVIADKIVPNLKSVENKGFDKNDRRITISMFDDSSAMEIVEEDEYELVPLKTVR